MLSYLVSLDGLNGFSLLGEKIFLIGDICLSYDFFAEVYNNYSSTFSMVIFLELEI